MGYVQGFFIDAFGNLREDTDHDGRLVYDKDPIVQIGFDSTVNDVKVDEFLDANGDGRVNSSTPIQTVMLKNIDALWEAGRRLALTSASSRTIYTWIDQNNNGRTDSGEWIDSHVRNAKLLEPYLALSFKGDRRPHFCS